MRPRVFLGYAMFWDDTPFPTSRQTVTKDTLYLKAHCLAKLNMIPMKWLDMPKTNLRYRFRDHTDEVNDIWRRRTDRRVQLRRVYAI